MLIGAHAAHQAAAAAVVTVATPSDAAQCWVCPWEKVTIPEYAVEAAMQAQGIAREHDVDWEQFLYHKKASGSKVSFAPVSTWKKSLFSAALWRIHWSQSWKTYGWHHVGHRETTCRNAIFSNFPWDHAGYDLVCACALQLKQICLPCWKCQGWGARQRARALVRFLAHNVHGPGSPRFCHKELIDNLHLQFPRRFLTSSNISET